MIQEGAFLVRTSEHGGQDQPYTLCVLHKGELHNIQICRREKGKFALGTKKQKETVSLPSVPCKGKRSRTTRRRRFGAANSARTTRRRQLDVGTIQRRPNSTRRRPPVFPLEMWTVHDRVVQHLDRTNNHAEAAHRRIQAELQIDHPTLWKFIDGLKKVQKGRDVFHEQLVAGHAPPSVTTCWQPDLHVLTDDRPAS